MSSVPLLSFFTEIGLTIPEMVFSMTIGLRFVSCFSSSDSRTIKFGNVVGKGSLSESLSGYGRLEGFDEAIKYVIYSSDVLPAHLGALLGGVLRA